jgi:hypothetical protein
LHRWWKATGDSEAQNVAQSEISEDHQQLTNTTIPINPPTYLQQQRQRVSRNRCFMRQTIIPNPTIIDNDSFWGHNLEFKQQNALRIAFRNVNYLPAKAEDSRNHEYMLDLKSANIDLIGISETNLAWNRLSDTHQPKEQWMGYFEAQSIVYIHNYANKGNTSINQSGGTLLFCQVKITYRKFGQGSDTTGLGRWVWLCFKGQQNHTLRIINIYCPVFSTGPLSAYQQHRSYLLDKGISTCPRQVFLDDLARSMEE